MSLEAIEMIVKAEQDGVSRRAAAEQEARNLTINAERDGQAMLSRLREEMETQRKELLSSSRKRFGRKPNRVPGSFKRKPRRAWHSRRMRSLEGS